MSMNWHIYHEDIPDFLLELSNTPEMQRLKNVGMNCGMEYTNYPLYKNIPSYSRFDHSMGVALIIYHFTHDRQQAISGLFHDIATPAFAHVIDFLNGDHIHQESTEDGTEEIITSSASIQKILLTLQIPTETVTDYHRYPIADNDSPKLSADRLEYTIGNARRYGFLTQQEAASIYGDLVVGCNEEGETELCFQSEEYARLFSFASLKCSNIYVSDENRYSMQVLADILKEAIQLGILSKNDLYKDEAYVIDQLKNSRMHEQWKSYRSLSQICTSDNQPSDNRYWLKVFAKKRYIDPLILNQSRTTQTFPKYKKQLEEFLSKTQDYWICGGELQFPKDPKQS